MVRREEVMDFRLGKRIQLIWERRSLLILPTLWHLSMHLGKKRMKNQPNYFDKIIQGRTKMLLSYPL